MTNEAGNPLRAVVRLYAGNAQQYAGVWSDAATGNYHIERVPEGNYKVFIPHTSNAPINYACVWYGGAGSFEAGVPIPVRAGQTTSNIDFRLETRQGVIEGYVTDGSGAPIQGISVSVYDAAAQTISQSIGATTDASGYYRVRYVPTGPVKIGFSAPAAGKSFVSEFYSVLDLDNPFLKDPKRCR